MRIVGDSDYLAVNSDGSGFIQYVYTADPEEWLVMMEWIRIRQ